MGSGSAGWHLKGLLPAELVVIGGKWLILRGTPQTLKHPAQKLGTKVIPSRQNFFLELVLDKDPQTSQSPHSAVLPPGDLSEPVSPPCLWVPQSLYYCLCDHYHMCHSPLLPQKPLGNRDNMLISSESPPTTHRGGAKLPAPSRCMWSC